MHSKILSEALFGVCAPRMILIILIAYHYRLNLAKNPNSNKQWCSMWPSDHGKNLAEMSYDLQITTLTYYHNAYINYSPQEDSILWRPNQINYSTKI